MARTRRLVDAVILRCAQELRATGSFRGRVIHVGRGRPRPGQIGFIDALARRTGYSRTIIMRVLGGRSRAGPRKTVGERGTTLIQTMKRTDLETAIQRLFQVAVDRVGIAGDPLYDERAPAEMRLARLVEILSTPRAGQQASQTSPHREPEPSGGYWRASPAEGAAGRTARPPSVPVAMMAREAALDALAALETTAGAVPEHMRTAVLSLRRQLEGTDG